MGSFSRTPFSRCWICTISSCRSKMSRLSGPTSRRMAVIWSIKRCYSTFRSIRKWSILSTHIGCSSSLLRNSKGSSALAMVQRPVPCDQCWANSAVPLSSRTSTKWKRKLQRYSQPTKALAQSLCSDKVTLWSRSKRMTNTIAINNIRPAGF